ncbi:amidase signature domain-containing protein [Xylariomycetidae sp. FL2044]|nr:amidase signature domain-containing protein [Xylariomycetidae sp. FL2044]
MAPIQFFDPLSATQRDLQRMLESGSVTSIQIIEQYLTQIEQYEPTFCILVSLPSREKILSVAAARDAERRRGRVRGPLHGIPIVLKDCFILTATNMGMTVCAGAVAFKTAKSSRNGPIVEKLIEAGLINTG